MEARRHSSRAIKRKRFFGEEVEKSGNDTKRHLDEELALANLPSSPPPAVSTSSSSTNPNSIIAPKAPEATTKNQASATPTSTTPVAVSSKKPPSFASIAKKNISRKRKGKKHGSKQLDANAVKDMGRWKATDDILLVNNVEQTKDLELVHETVKFTCRFTLEEVTTRWYALLYDPVISSHAKQAICNLPHEVAKEYHAKTLFSDAEEEILAAIPSSSNCKDLFEDMLRKNILIFHHSRTAEMLVKHWNMMKFYCLLCDQAPSEDMLVSDDEDLASSATAANNSPSKGMTPTNHDLDTELKICQQRELLEIYKVERELEKSRSDMRAAGLLHDDTDKRVTAILQGRVVRFLMQSKEITFGRQTDQNIVDVDLSLEGPANKISRRQGQIKEQANGEFIIINEGKRPIYVDGRAVLQDAKAKLVHNSVIELATLRFSFRIQ